MKIADLFGHQWLLNQHKDTITDFTKKVKAIEGNNCSRCHQRVTAQLPNGEKYCRSCIGLGRISEKEYLIRFKDHQQFTYSSNNRSCLTWHGKLTKQQARVSQELTISFKKKRNHLVHAVTGAGKTEMLFQVIDTALMKGARVAIATPRIDVVNELYPRLSSAFKEINIGKYHGKEYCEPKNQQFIICTTHQLLKFYHAFDLLIIDEVDSFPYINNPMLNEGAKEAVRPNGCCFYLTATPDKSLLLRAKKNEMGYSLLNRRFHGSLLPVPQNQHYLQPFIKNGKINHKLLATISRLLRLEKPILVFIPRIAELPIYERALKKYYSKIKINSVYAGNKKRQEKVQAFRDKALNILLTTTILERGVTFPHVQVIVVAADDKIYTTPSLVQIAGRVGRSIDDTQGKVIFCYHKYTQTIRQANQQIRDMNR